ncbi:MAG: UvrB/UvrC motif-containing protein, partial [Candidatus Sungbacteria bacterium]|nr:UvrB/UvrC motif-containing protein [Candidatus Sungbacteria bacterium]
GRAARHINGTVIMYADVMTDSMKQAIDETDRRRDIQIEFNRKHGITPAQIKKEIRKSILEESEARNEEIAPLIPHGPKKEIIRQLELEMKKAAKELNFELAARIRDRINKMNL